MVSFSLRQRLLFRPSQDIRPVSFHLSQFAEAWVQPKALDDICCLWHVAKLGFQPLTFGRLAQLVRANDS